MKAKITVPYQVIVADDASPQRGVSRLADVPNLSYIRQSKNVGFLQNCNAAFQEIKANYVLLLNNDAQITPGSVESMARVLDSDLGVAAVGPKILYPNGRLQEAGCTVQADGSSQMIGVFEDAADPKFCYSRDVDYCSGAALLIRRLELGV
jgi:O-antigen biosynthesis protein